MNRNNINFDNTYVYELFNKYYLLTLNNYGYNKNNLLLIKKSNNLQVNDDVLFLENNKIKQGSIEEIIENKYILSNKKVVDSSKILSSKKNIKTLYFLGLLYNLLTSKIGYLIIVILPIFIVFICEIYQIIKEIKR